MALYDLRIKHCRDSMGEKNQIDSRRAFSLVKGLFVSGTPRANKARKGNKLMTILHEKIKTGGGNRRSNLHIA